MFFATIGVIPTASEIEEEGSPKQEPTELADPTIDKEIISTDTETLVIGQDDNIVSETIEKAVTEETITVEPVMEKVTQLETVLPEKPSPAPNTSPGSTKSVEAPKTLRFLSLYPNATGSDEEEEYILIENTGTEAVDLRGWSIEDESTDRYEFVASSVIQAGMTFTLGRPQSKLTLNNDGDTLTLIAPDGEMLDRVTYENSLQGETYDLIEETWRWSGATTVTQFVGTEPTATQSTPAASTITSIPSAATPTATTTARSVSTFSPVATSATSAAIPVSSSARSTLLLSISDAKQRLDGQRVIVKGIITAAPGTFGSQIFYLQDATGGIQAYLHSGDFPELSVGDGIQIMGELSTSHGERRVKLANASSIAWINGIVGSEPIELILSDTNESVLGQLMKTHGQIQSIDTNKLVIEETGATLTIYLKSSPAIDAQAFARGDKIEVIGVLTTYDGELRLRPRSTDDLQTVEKISGTMAVTSESTVSSSAGIILFSTTVTALIALALWRFLTHKRLTTVTA
jgi:DNA/RNA endonuclease YhcR with UshA esterase domain